MLSCPDIEKRLVDHSALPCRVGRGKKVTIIKAVTLKQVNIAICDQVNF
jgi:hypothetical protein